MVKVIGTAWAQVYSYSIVKMNKLHGYSMDTSIYSYSIVKMNKLHGDK